MEKTSCRAIVTREVAVRPLDELQVAEVALVAQVGEVVLGAAGALDLAGVGQQGARLAEQVERDVGQRDVLLELRRAGDPLAEPLGEDERVVAEPEGVRRERRRGACVPTGLAHRCCTSAGMS